MNIFPSAPPSRRHRMLPGLLLLIICGCQNNRALMPPPGGSFGATDPYYQAPLGTPAGVTQSPPAVGGSTVNLAPSGLPNLPPPPGVTSATSGSKLRALPDTYDVSTRVAADNQPIRVLDSSQNTGGTLAGVPRGMPLNDGMSARTWSSGMTLPPTVATNPFGQLRGTSGDRSSSPQGFSGQDGQWRSRSSYEGTERR